MTEIESGDTKPRVSICTQVLNQSEWLKEMIASVVAQTYSHWELIIVDDGSTEDIKAVIESFNDNRISYHRFDVNQGNPTGSNYALRRAKGEFVGLLSADEVISPEKLTEQLEYLDTHPNVDAVWGIPGRGAMGKRTVLEQNHLRAHNRSREAWIRTLINLENVPIGGASMLMRTKVMDELGYLDESLNVFSDHELYCRFFEKYVGVILPYRWAVDKEATETSVRAKNAHKSQQEYDYVVQKHPLILPSVTGKVTVGIPCYNQARYLKDVVASVTAQTYQDLEILILNDGSTDNFTDIATKLTDPRIKLIAFDENMGIQEALNQMAFRAEGEFFVVVAADDTIEPTLIERSLAEFAADPWTEFVATQTDFMLEDMTPYTGQQELSNTNLTPNKNELYLGMLGITKPVNRTREEWFQQLYVGNHYFGVGMYRTKAISEVGGWSKEFEVISDYEMYLKLLERENIRIIEEPLTHTRLHDNNHSMLRGERASALPDLYRAARKDHFAQRLKVYIATPFYELKAFSPYVMSLTTTLRLLTMMGIEWQYLEISGDSYVHRARNTLCDSFMKDPDATDLFFIDSDMSWDPQAFVKMLLLPQEVVGGAYPVKNKWDAWTSIPMEHEEEGKAVIRGIELNDGTAMVEARVLAGGFLRIKRSALEKYRNHYPDLWYREPSTNPDAPEHKYTQFFAAESMDHQFIGEDHMFSRRMRDMGIQMFIYPNVDIIHWGYKDFGGNFHKHLRGVKEEQIGTEKQGGANAFKTEH